jgi:hypothetical protein
MTTQKMLHLLKVSHRLIKPISNISAYSYLGHEVKLSVFYPFDLLLNHRGSFQQSKAKLVQLNIKDIQKLYEKHCPGTVVLIPQIYQVNGHSVCVLAESMEAIKILPIPTLPETQGTTTLCSGSNSPMKLTQAFTPFQSPSKKHKMDM